MRYRLALDLGSTSLGWAMVLLDGQGSPCAIVRAGVRIFSDGREAAPKGQVGSSLAATRRQARALRRRRDRLLRRKARMQRLLIKYGFFPSDEATRDLLAGLGTQQIMRNDLDSVLALTEAARKELETRNPYALRAKGLNEALEPGDFARALFHINQRRGFKSNRKADKADKDSSALKDAVESLRAQLDPAGAEGKARTVGELLWRRLTNEHVPAQERTVRARPNDQSGPKRKYDLYIDRSMIADEFDALWEKQASINPTLFNEVARDEIRDCLLHQRALRPVKPGRCTLIPYLTRAPMALPSQQRFRMYQEVHNLRIQRTGQPDERLNREERNKIIDLLERRKKELSKPHEVSFDQMRVTLGLGSGARFNLEDVKRNSLKGNLTTTALSKRHCFGALWNEWSERQQDAVVRQLVTQQRRDVLVRRLKKYCLVDNDHAEAVADARLPDGYGALSRRALASILPEFRCDPEASFADAARRAGYHHSDLSQSGEVPGRTDQLEHIDKKTGEIFVHHIFKKLPYYGEFLQRHVGFADPDAALDPDADPDSLSTHILEKYYGRIANPTVHIGLNQVRQVVNALISRYGRPSEIVVEVARDLKQSSQQREEAHRQQTRNQERNKRIRRDIADAYTAQGQPTSPDQIKRKDVEKWILWEELNPRDCQSRRCPYSGAQIGVTDLLSERVEIEHILPFSQTLDDSLNNKTVAMRRANRIKNNRTPAQAREDFARQGWAYDDILLRAESMAGSKSYRFKIDGFEKWLRDDKGFLARALNDTRYMSRVAREYLRLVCPQDTRVIPGQMTAMLRGLFGLSAILGPNGEKNRNDHRHHAIDACVIAVTDQGMLQRFARANADAREKQLERLVDTMPLPWDTYREHVSRAVNAICVSHKPDHSHEGGMMEATAYGIRKDGSIRQRKKADGSDGREVRNLIRIGEPRQPERHGLDAGGAPRPYIGYLGGSNYCIEIVRSDKGKWEGEVVTTFGAYQRVAAEERQRRKGGAQIESTHEVATAVLRASAQSINSGRPLVMRLMIGDSVLIEKGEEGSKKTKCLLRVVKIDPSTNVVLAEINEAGELKKRHDDEGDTFRYTNLRGGSFQRARARRVTISPIGELRDPGFKD